MIGILIAAIVFFTFLVLVGWVIGIYNTLVTAEKDIDGQWADIKMEYQRRADLFFNLVQMVKSHMKFERGTLKDITQARGGVGKGTIKQQTQKMGVLDNLFQGLKIQVEAYPDLKSNVHYTKIMEEIRVIEDRVASARGELNNMVEDYNTYLHIFPTNIITRMVMKKKEKKYFEATDKEAPKSYKIDNIE